jgi:hypothetical protein
MNCLFTINSKPQYAPNTKNCYLLEEIWTSLFSEISSSCWFRMQSRVEITCFIPCYPRNLHHLPESQEITGQSISSCLGCCVVLCSPSYAPC